MYSLLLFVVILLQCFLHIKSFFNPGIRDLSFLFPNKAILHYDFLSFFSNKKKLKYFERLNNNAEKQPKLDFNEDYYSVLEVNPNADSKDLKKAYLKLVFSYHPDNKLNKDNLDLRNRQMMVINSAYKVLKDPKTRMKYDATRNHKIKQNFDTSERIQQNKMNFVKEKEGSNNNFNPYVGSSEPVEPVEPVSTILRDIWEDISKNQGSTVIGDLIDFLESLNGDSEFQEKQDLEDSAVYSLKIKKIQGKIDELKVLLNLEKSMLIIDEKNYSSAPYISNIEKLKLLESILARKQRIKRISAELIELNNEACELESHKNSTNHSRSVNTIENDSAKVRTPSQTAVATTQTIDEQLQQMKKDLGIIK